VHWWGKGERLDDVLNGVPPTQEGNSIQGKAGGRGETRGDPEGVLKMGGDVLIGLTRKGAADPTLKGRHFQQGSPLTGKETQGKRVEERNWKLGRH